MRTRTAAPLFEHQTGDPRRLYDHAQPLLRNVHALLTLSAHPGCAAILPVMRPQDPTLWRKYNFEALVARAQQRRNVRAMQSTKHQSSGNSSLPRVQSETPMVLRRESSS